MTASTAQRGRYALAAIAAVAALAITVVFTLPGRSPGRAFPPLVPAAAPAVWPHLTLPNGTAVLSYPPSLHPLAGDTDAVSAGRLGPGGAYQFYLGAAFIERVVPSWNVDAVMIPQLKAANVYGWFSTAWGGMYLDFGAIGALVGVLFCGWLAGRVFRGALVNRTDGSRLLMCYVVAGILATPVLSIFTISISLPILAALLITAYFLRPNHILPVWFRLPRRTPLPVR